MHFVQNRVFVGDGWTGGRDEGRNVDRRSETWHRVRAGSIGQQHFATFWIAHTFAVLRI